ncbi:prepilin peptidase [Thiospirochaeta perfilievii]|uniref:Prepilin peptidase n=1 Tax=Thiospirochaeta perfilievii TaxID=252967 RepID=A0A5C1QBH0_9SPIO|nr:prepilin peptidase [Thiospirochaeta perfilievii]QEN04219.1 prepilin peptidase [Thiospirochaeta perfilievii]
MILFLIIASTLLAIYDIKKLKVPNLGNLLLLVVVFGNLFLTNYNIIPHIISGLAAFLTFILIYFISKRKLGMGDCKYTAIIALHFGYNFWLYSVMTTSIIALFVTIPLLLSKKIKRDTKIPFMPFLVSGWILYYFLT